VWKIVRPLRAMASKTVDVNAVVVGSLFLGRVSDHVTGAYDAMQFHGATLQDLPDEPRSGSTSNPAYCAAS
jgi:NTE family protein